MIQNLVDASAFLKIIKLASVQNAAECLEQSAILDLAFYEVGNGIWKESALTKNLTPDQAKALERVAETILSRMNLITCSAQVFGEILEIARSEKLTFYDASYIFFAKQNGIRLITEDKSLQAKAQKHGQLETTASLIQHGQQ